MRLDPHEAAKRLLKLRQPACAVPSVREPVSGATRPPLPYRHNLIGVANAEELRENAILKKQSAERGQEKPTRRAPNYMGPRKITCPCGTIFEIPRSYPEDGKKYCSDPCRKKFGGKRSFYKFSPEVDEKIRAAYADKIGMSRAPTLKTLAAEIGIPGYVIRKRALVLGLTITMLFPDGRKACTWKEEERQIVRDNAACCFATIRKKLQQAGFDRSENAVKIFIQRRMGHKPKSAYSANMLAERFGVDAHCITRWIRKKLIKAEMAGTTRTAQQGGDSYLIAPADVREFVIKYTALVDFRKIDKFWLVEVLTGKEIELTN